MSFYEVIYAIKMRLSKQVTFNAKIAFLAFSGLVLEVLLPSLTQFDMGAMMASQCF